MRFFQDGPFDWDLSTQGYILASLYYGYVLTQIPGGLLAERYGGKRVMGYGILVTSVFTLLTPIAARTHYYALIFVRFVEGTVRVSSTSISLGAFQATMRQFNLRDYSVSA